MRIHKFAVIIYYWTHRAVSPFWRLAQSEPLCREVANINGLRSNDHEVPELAVVPVEFRPLVSSEAFPLANNGRLVEFMLACTRSRLFCVNSE